MKIKVYRIALFLIGIIGLIIQFMTYGPTTLLYYSVFSNIVTTSFNGYIAFKKTDLTPVELRFKGGITMLIILAFLVFHVQLAPYIVYSEFFSARNTIIHYLVPILTTADTIMFDVKQVYKKYTPITWSVLPLLYCAVALINGKFLGFEVPDTVESPYPYFFLNLNKLSLFQVGLNIGLILIVYTAISYYLYYFMSKEEQ